jgi:hypothetical protein
VEWYQPYRERNRYMRKYLHLAMAAGCAAAFLTSSVTVGAAQAASTGGGHVLTLGKAGGNAVRSGAVLKASLAKGTKAVFALGSEKLSCTSSTLTVKVKKNPAKPGTATETLTAQTISKCTVNVKGIKVKAVGAKDLPYNVTVSDSKGRPVRVSGASKKKPVELFATAGTSGTKVTCTYKIAAIKATSTTKGNSIVIAKQKFFMVSGGIFCPATASFSATFGPVKDTSVKGAPAVFVN